jgi:aminodeoxyfutalosine synthase
MADGEAPNWQSTLSDLMSQDNWPGDLAHIVDKLSQNIPLSLDDGKFLFHYRNLNIIGHLASIVKQSRFDNKVFFNVNVHINQTNICTLACKFCAFRRGRRAEDSYQLEVGAYIEDLRKYSDHVDEVHSVGGLHPEWGIEHYSELFSKTREEFPHVHIKALTAVEVKHIAKLSGLSIHDTLARLKDSGLGSLPGGGAEILDDEVREVICRGKESSEEYLEIHRTAHKLGIPTNCTMLYGTIESIEHRVMHMIKLRELQNETAGFQCFVPYPFLPDDSRLPEAQLATGAEILRVIAVSRLMLNNIPHIKAYRMNLGDDMSELALQFGADDIDGTVQKESIMHLAGSTASLDLDKVQLAKIVSNSGSIPIQRNTIYSSFVEFVPPIIPERRSLRMAVGD